MNVNDLPAYRYFILDMDGTVVDTAPDIVRSANRTLQELGLENLPYETVASFIGGGVPKLMQRCLAERAGERAEELQEEGVKIFTGFYTAEPAVDSTLYPTVLDTMKSIAERGGRFGICTQKPEALAQAILDTLGIGSLVEVLVGPESVTHRKPHPEPVLKVLTDFSASAKDAIFVGDTASDMAAAHAAGVVTCGVTYGYGSADSVQSENPRYLVDSFDALLTHVSVS